MENKKIIGTHSEVFHCDEVHGVMMLQNFTKEFKNGKIIRSRNSDVLKTADIVIDVGGEYDPSKNLFDHHQRGFEEYYDPENGFGKVKLSASGLVFKHFGPEIVTNALEYIFDEEKSLDLKFKRNLNETQIKELCYLLYEKYFEHLDADDNGQNAYPKNISPLYRNNATSISHRIGRLNTPWWETATSEKQDQMFLEALKVAKEEFLDKVKFIYMKEILCRDYIKEFLGKRKEVHPSGKILLLEKHFAWKEALLKEEKEMGIEGEILFVIYKNITGESYRVSTVPVSPGSFEFRLGLHSDWRGKMQNELQETSGIADMVFCHHSGFIGGAVSYESSLKMAEISMNQKEMK
jgi:uncharacterized UPF0160 family protein